MSTHPVILDLALAGVECSDGWWQAAGGPVVGRDPEASWLPILAARLGYPVDIPRETRERRLARAEARLAGVAS